MTGSGQSSEPVTTPAPSAPTQAEPSTPRASLPNLDAAVHRATQIAINGLDQGTVWGNPLGHIPDATTRLASNPGLAAGEAIAYTYVRGTLENVETASNANASTGDRAAASGWLLFDVLGGAVVGMVAKWARGGATAANVADDAATAIYRMTNTRGGAARMASGAAREARVAAILDGRVSGEVFRDLRFGRTDIDVISASGDLVSVGGPAKALNLQNFGRSLRALQAEAARRGVSARAFLERGTPEAVIREAERILGHASVFVF